LVEPDIDEIDIVAGTGSVIENHQVGADVAIGVEVSLYHAANARIRTDADGKKIAHYDLTEDASNDNGMVFGELVRDGMGWKFKAIGIGTTGGLYKIARDYGVNVAPG
jgi:tellurium resistance protein TerD